MDETKEEENNHDKEIEENSWWGSLPVWFQAAKEKSSTALEFMKRDLSEFSQTVQTDAAAAISSTAALLKDKLMIESADSVATKAKESITSILGTITDVFIPQKELEDAEMYVIRNSEPVALDWWQAQLHLIQKDPRTYCHEPEGPPEVYENWLATFDIDDYQEEMKDIMRNCTVVRALYEDLVPSAVSHLEFWQRYYYRVHLLRKAEAKRAELLKKADAISLDDIEWDKGDGSLQGSKAECSNASSGSPYDVRDHPFQRQSHVPRDSGAVSKMETVSRTSKPITAPSAGNFTQVPQKAFLIDSTKSVDASDLNTTSNTSENYKSIVNSKDFVSKQTAASGGEDPEGSKTAGNENVAEMNLEDNRAASPESNKSGSKDSNTSDEWEKDFDSDVPESDLRIPDESVKHLVETNEDDEGWVRW